MADKTIEQDEAVTEAESTEEAAPETAQVKKQKVTFSEEQQAEVQRIVAKEKASWKRSTDRDKEGWTETEKSLRAQLTARDEVIQKQVDLLKQDLELDEITVELLAEKDALEQFNTLVKIMEKKGKQNIPRTPSGEKKKPELRSSFSPSV